MDTKKVTTILTSQGEQKEWKAFAAKLLGEAHLPRLGLPARWETTEKKHQLIAFDPKTKKQYVIEGGKITETKGAAAGFIRATKGQHSLPGSDTPASVRVQRHSELTQQAEVESAWGDTLLPCFAHGDYVKVESLESDHLQAKSEIMRRQIALVKKLNDEPEFAKFILEQPGMKKFFTKVGDEYYGTLFFYEVYFNDIVNIWLICDACNAQKKDQDALSWLKDKWTYGQRFLDYVTLTTEYEKDKTILTKVQSKLGSKSGLATVAIEWFWTQHAKYILTGKRIEEKIKKPLMILNIKVDHVMGAGSEKRGRRLQSTLEFKMDLVEAVLKTKGMGMPKGSSESDHSSSEEDDRFKFLDKEGNEVKLSRDFQTQMRKEVVQETPKILTDLMKSKTELFLGSLSHVESGKEKLKPENEYGKANQKKRTISAVYLKDGTKLNEEEMEREESDSKRTKLK